MACVLHCCTLPRLIIFIAKLGKYPRHQYTTKHVDEAKLINSSQNKNVSFVTSAQPHLAVYEGYVQLTSESRRGIEINGTDGKYFKENTYF